MTAPDEYAIYARRSRKKARRQRNDRETVERQVALCRKHAAEAGPHVAEEHVYVDNDRCAWKPDGKREQWDAMIAAGRRREFDGLLAYKLDRFARNVRDAEDLVDLAGKRRVVIDGPNSGRIDLSTANGQAQLPRGRGAGAAESDNTSERVKDALAERAADGLLLGGGRLFGFEVLSEDTQGGGRRGRQAAAGRGRADQGGRGAAAGRGAPRPHRRRTSTSEGSPRCGAGSGTGGTSGGCWAPTATAGTPP